MRILLLTHYYAPEIGAPQRRWRELVSGFTAAGHEVAVCAPVPHYPHSRSRDLGRSGTRKWEWEDGEYGERILRLPYVYTSSSMVRQLVDQGTSSAAALAVAAAMRGNRPDVVISTTPGLPMLFTGEAVARLLGVPHVAEVRDAWPDLIADSSLVTSASKGLVPKAIADRAERQWLPALFTGVQKRAEAVVVTTEGFAQRLRERGVGNVTCIRNTARVDEHAVHWRPAFSPDTPLRLAYVGTVGRSQGLQTLVHAVGNVSGVELRIVGAGAACAELEAAAAPHADRIRFLPQTVGPELENLWAWAHSGVVSLEPVPAFEYTIPSKIYTLMAKGVHITGALSGEAAAIVRESGAGHVAEPGDPVALERLITDLRTGALPVTQKPSAMQWIREHASPERAVATYLEVLAEAAR
ncbi:glycosyltransferase family 4 protein [Brevibacterium samyangense]|uniref:D-inositol 3-phosphate glycosyltransferase n=1 Tax=Brevibacterium samyangense TaxID=366888 RepID=A0ABN2TQS7_9MICO